MERGEKMEEVMTDKQYTEDKTDCRIKTTIRYFLHRYCLMPLRKVPKTEVLFAE
jgi:hypothetical protein